MINRNKIIRILLLLVLAVLSMPPPGASAAPHLQAGTTTPIQHFIVVMQQNHTFDNYFGTYPGANGVPPGTCMPISLSNPDETGCVAPFRIDSYTLEDLNHSKTTFEYQYQDGEMDGFVEALNRLNQDGALAMGYYDEQDLPYYWNLADQFVLFDNYFSSARTGSITNRMFSIAGQPGAEFNRIPEQGFGDIPTIFDKLEERGISWKYYIKDYNPELNYRNLQGLDYLPPQVQWVPLLGYARFLDDPELFSRIVDLDEYYVDLENGTLPAVSYVLLLGATEHPLGDLSLGQRTTRTMIQMLMQSDAWESSALLITYDDWGGWYDHVAPPKVDEYGYGFRVPALLVSAYAHQGNIDHTLLDHTSILKFIGENWGIQPLAERDAKANNFLSAFDFTAPPREPMLISGSREAPDPYIQPRRSVIFIAYGAAMLIAFFILIRAGVTSDIVRNPAYDARTGKETKP